MAEEAGGMILSSKAISHGGKIPRKYTQDGQGAVKDVSPPLEWYEVPEGTESLAIIMEDPDSPDPADPSPNPFVHWVVVNIPPTMKGLPEGFTVKDHGNDDDEASEILEGVNDFKSTGYRGPIPSDSEHRYEIHFYALDTKLKVPKKPSRDRVLEAMDGHILAESLLVATFGMENSQAGYNRYMPAGLANLSGPGRANTKGNSNAMGQIHGR
jgi:Raf kinase inhibitor-like YbhB/YbcL family protein